MRKNIVVVEDDKDVIEVLRYSLEEEYFVHVAKDGIAGLELTARVVPNLVLLDLSLPKLDGIEVCRRLREDERMREIPLIILTGKMSEQDLIMGLEAGADD